jgi:hypothetical protein
MIYSLRQARNTLDIISPGTAKIIGIRVLPRPLRNQLPCHQAYLFFAEIRKMFEPGAVFEIYFVILGGKIRRTAPG